MSRFGSGNKAKFRSFNPNWYKQFPWLEYSVVADAAYCYCCRHFLPAAKRGSVKAFVANEFRNWKRATGKDGSLTSHNASPSDKDAMVLWLTYKSMIKSAQSVCSLASKTSSRKLCLHQDCLCSSASDSCTANCTERS